MSASALVVAVASASATLSFSGNPQDTPGRHPMNGQIVHVANNGLDNDQCGRAEQPCRSIGRAIDNASEGDTILVGPGLYGDLNRDRDLNDPGEERQDFADASCMICVNKRVRIISTYGANATRIETSTAGTLEEPIEQLVRLSDGVTFGEPGHGFLLFSLPRTALLAAGSDVSIGGNIIRPQEQEAPRDLEVPPQRGIHLVNSRGTVRLSENLVIDHHFGIAIEGGNANVVLVRNVALQNSWEGFTIGGSGHIRAFGNYASGNGGALRQPSIEPPTGREVFPTAGAGFLVTAGNANFGDNVSIGNFGPGFRIDPPQSGGGARHFRNNLTAGNLGAGFHISNRAGDSPVQISLNNIFGNLDGERGCGLINESGATVDARNNFWGAPTGPGGDPADAAGPDSGCDRREGSETRVTPFATELLPVVPGQRRDR